MYFNLRTKMQKGFTWCSKAPKKREIWQIFPNLSTFSRIFILFRWFKDDSKS